MDGNTAEGDADRLFGMLDAVLGLGPPAAAPAALPVAAPAALAPAAPAQQQPADMQGLFPAPTPDAFRCPLTLEVMDHPVFAPADRTTCKPPSRHLVIPIPANVRTPSTSSSRTQSVH